jgi:hypothetical protein
MNNSNFNQTGGYPLKTERLQEMQTAYSIFNSLGALAGNLTIISGCVVTGTTVGDGFVYINGELIEFKEADGAGTPAVIIIETPVNRSFKNGVIKLVHTLRYATFGTAVDSWPWSDFKRLDPIISMMARLTELEKKNAVFQSGGGMVLWNKPLADIPTGWQEVVDWRGRMPVGFDENDLDFNIMGKMSGYKTKTLSESEMPAHSHPYKDIYFSEVGGSVFIPGHLGSGDSDSDNNGYELNRTTDLKGGGQSFSILNPYRVVLFIEYIG